MSLRKKMLIIIGLAFISVAFVLYAVTRTIVIGSFINLEDQDVRTNVKRAMSALEETISGINSVCGDWAPWNDTRDFVLYGNKQFVEDNLNDSTLTNLRLNFILVFNTSGKLIYSKGVDLIEEKDHPVSKALIKRLSNHKSLFEYAHLKDSKSGIILFPEGPILISSWPISNNDEQGPVNGTLIFGRYLDEREITNIADRTHLSIHFTRIDSSRLPTDFKSAQSVFSIDQTIVIQELSENTIAGYMECPDILGNPCLILRVDMPRDILLHGKKSTNYFIAVLLAIGAILLIVLLIALQSIIIGPVANLTNHVLTIKKSGDLESRLFQNRQDEIGTLANEFNGMLGKLSEAHNKLTEQSYKSGLAEMASGILHNIRNILNPMVGQISILRNKINNVPLDNIERAASELETENLDDERKKALNRYMQLGSISMVDLVRETNDQLQLFSNYISQIEEILGKQDKYSHTERALEPLHLDAIIKEATDLMPQELQKSVAIEMDSDISQQPKVRAERVILLQVLMNLFNNAVESILRADTPSGKIRINAEVESEDDINVVHAEIRDNGEGLDEETLKRIFEKGFSKKESMRSGIGLHWCSNVVSAMDGNLYAESDGIGQGSCFHLKIPVSS